MAALIGYITCYVLVRVTLFRVFASSNFINIPVDSALRYKPVSQVSVADSNLKCISLNNRVWPNLRPWHCTSSFVTWIEYSRCAEAIYRSKYCVSTIQLKNNVPKYLDIRLSTLFELPFSTSQASYPHVPAFDCVKNTTSNKLKI